MARLYVLFAITFLVVTVDCDPLETVKKLTASVRRKCLAKTGTTAEIVDNAEYGSFPDDEKLACYFYCVLDTFKMMQSDGTLAVEKMKKIVPEEFKELGLDMIDSCGATKGKDNCDTAFQFNKCLYFSNPVAYFVV